VLKYSGNQWWYFCTVGGPGALLVPRHGHCWWSCSLWRYERLWPIALGRKSLPESSYGVPENLRPRLSWTIRRFLNLSRAFLNALPTGAHRLLYFNLLPLKKSRKAIQFAADSLEYDEKAFSQIWYYVVKFRPFWLASIPLPIGYRRNSVLRRSPPREVGLGSQGF